ncbi:hypothetical protein DPMN_144848 [Dreissena polymorpha]|uniref:Uncharacterized protein n=1 Tax=Dreissena polymorpha TaxID=45954 RepID=A0A9D4F2U6_DREPO|nr:hypothetical protein DPMN_144848 [Dreissena polymorpha]
MCVRDVRSILGAAGFYRRFCPSYSEVVEPLINLTRKNIRDNTDDEENIPLAELQKHLRNKQFADIQSSSSESDTMHYNNGNSQNSPVRTFENDSSDDQMQIDALLRPTITVFIRKPSFQSTACYHLQPDVKYSPTGRLISSPRRHIASSKDDDDDDDDDDYDDYDDYDDDDDYDDHDDDEHDDFL